MKLFDYAGYQIPVDLVNITGAGPDSFDDISQGHMAYLRQHVGIAPGDSVLEVGCGIGRDAIPLTGILSPDLGGRYVGIDIIGRSIAWCASNITPKHPNFTFVHFDVKDQLHNPGGSQGMQTVRLPLQDSSVDTVILWSVFTHMFEADIVHYLREFRRVLRPKGRVFFSCFIVDAAILECDDITLHHSLNF
jgi:SAM-dependent methyltransferase